MHDESCEVEGCLGELRPSTNNVWHSDGIINYLSVKCKTCSVRYWLIEWENEFALLPRDSMGGGFNRNDAIHKIKQRKQQDVRQNNSNNPRSSSAVDA